MKDEYEILDSKGDTFLTYNFTLECGEVLKEAHVIDSTYQLPLLVNYHTIFSGQIQYIRRSKFQ